jgi:hypothetical protein
MDEVRRYARARLPSTPSMEQIALSTRQGLLGIVYTRLLPVTEFSLPSRCHQQVGLTLPEPSNEP